MICLLIDKNSNLKYILLLLNPDHISSSMADAGSGTITAVLQWVSRFDSNQDHPTYSSTDLVDGIVLFDVPSLPSVSLLTKHPWHG